MSHVALSCHQSHVIARTPQFAEIIAEKVYDNADYTFLTGSWGYDKLWSTPTSTTAHIFLDLLGYHDSVARHVELFRKDQGHVKPPGLAYDLHAGYFATPKSLTAFDWYRPWCCAARGQRARADERRPRIHQPCQGCFRPRLLQTKSFLHRPSTVSRGTTRG